MLALQSIIEQLMRPELIWVLIPLAGIGIGALAIIFEPIKDSIRKTERAEARKLYERLALEKLDVIKTAVAMGYSREELADLDSRLERLIGAEQMKLLRDGKTPKVPMPEVDLPGDDLDRPLPSRSARQQEK